MSAKSVKIAWTLEEKAEIIQEYEKSGMNKAAFSKSHGIPRTTLVGILSAKETILHHTIKANNRKRLRTSKFDEVETSLVRWINEARVNNIVISGNILKQKALEIASELGETFLASNGWIERFKERNGISFKNNREAKAVNSYVASQCTDSPLQHILRRYHESDIFNLDETGLFFRLQPQEIQNITSAKCSSNFINKFTILLGANMNGTEKLKPVVIGSNMKPKCLENVKSLPVTYEANAKALMTSTIWERTLRSLDKKFVCAHRKVLFIIDSCAVHAQDIDLKAIQMIYLFPNVTPVLQPLNRGAIQNFKLHYRKFLVKDMLNALDHQHTFDVSVLDALLYISKSWSCVSEAMIRNCFRHAGFIFKQNSPTEAVTEDIGDLSPLFADLRSRGLPIPENEHTYVNIDVNVKVSDESSITDFVDEALDKQDNIPVESCDAREEIELQKLPTNQQALSCLDILRRHVVSVDNISDTDYEFLNSLEKKILFNNSDKKCVAIHQEIGNSMVNNNDDLNPDTYSICLKIGLPVECSLNGKTDSELENYTK